LRQQRHAPAHTTCITNTPHHKDQEVAAEARQEEKEGGGERRRGRKSAWQTALTAFLPGMMMMMAKKPRTHMR